MNPIVALLATFLLTAVNQRTCIRIAFQIAPDPFAAVVHRIQRPAALLRAVPKLKELVVVIDCDLSDRIFRHRFPSSFTYRNAPQIAFPMISSVGCSYPVTSFSLPAAVAVKWSDVNAGSDWQLVPANLKPEGANPVMHWVPAAGGSTVTNDIIDGEVYRLTDADYIIAYGYKAFSVTATSRSGVSRTCRVHLYNNITGLRTGLGMNLQVGKTATANVLLLLDGTPVSGLTDLYTLTSSAPGVVKVLADGQLKALKTGTATITAATTDGRYSATFTVKAFKAQQLPAALTEIGPEAFAGSSFAAVMIPDGCTAIGSKAFANCTALERIYIPASVTTIAPDAFDGCHPIICAPAGSAAAAFGAAAGFTVEPY